MAKVTLVDVGNFANPLSARLNINENFERIEEAMENTLSRDGTSPNQMEADIDLDSHKLLNVGDASSDGDAVNLRQLQLLLSDVATGTDPGLRIDLAAPDGSDLIEYDGSTVKDFLDVLDAAEVSTLRSDLLAPTTGAAQVGYQTSGIGSQARTVGSKLGETLSLLDSIPVAEHAAILAGTSTFDATTYVQAAITDAILSRRKLYAPGHYRLTAPVNITGALTLHGDGCEMQVADLGSVQTRGKGSWFHLDHAGVGFKLNDPTQYRSGITLDGIGTYRTQPDTTGGSFTPTAFGFDIEVMRCDAQLRDVCIYNATNGIKHYTGGYGRLQIDRLRGQPLTVGIQVDDSADTCRFRDIHFWPFFSNSASVRTHLRANAKALILKDVDNPDIAGMFTLGYAYGVSCEPLAGTLAMPLKVRLSNFDFDNGGYGFSVAAGGANGVTAILSHGYILGVSVGGPANASNIDIGGNNNAIQIDNVGLDLPQDCNIKVSGTGNKVRVGNVSVGRWNFDGGASFGIEVGTGNTLRMSNSPLIETAGTATAVFGGAGTINCPLGAGVFTGSTDASGFLSVTHGLGIAPRYVTVNGQSGSAYAIFPTTTKSSTVFQVQARLTTTGAVVASTSITLEWVAWY